MKIRPLVWEENVNGNFYAEGFMGNRYEIYNVDGVYFPSCARIYGTKEEVMEVVQKDYEEFVRDYLKDFVEFV